MNGLMVSFRLGKHVASLAKSSVAPCQNQQCAPTDVRRERREPKISRGQDGTSFGVDLRVGRSVFDSGKIAGSSCKTSVIFGLFVCCLSNHPVKVVCAAAAVR